ncbi:MAG: ribosome small subunit-dependent GTPase A [Clostridia bacterium]|nr:ribosome small subunit-dependent GTPase A [Clostridia bacterium]
MSEKKNLTGTLIKGVGGLYEIEVCDEGTYRLVHGRARGVLRHEKISPLPGDAVTVSFGEATETFLEGADADTAIDAILPRKNALVRPPLANLDYLFLVLPAANPTPMPEVADKLICLCETKGIEPVVVVTKEDLDGQTAEKLARLYRRAGFTAFTLSTVSGEGVEAFRTYLKELFHGDSARICAFSGASGAGKSSLMNILFPTLSLEAGELSRKIGRGKNTTRHTELYRISELFGAGYSGYLADTPGFSMLDFTHGFSFPLNELAHTFREFRPYIGGCRYTKCTHTKEEECAILEAVKEGIIPRSRHRSYVSMYGELKQIPEWKRMKMNENK